MNICVEARLLVQQRDNQAHCRAHDAHDHDRDFTDDELWTVNSIKQKGKIDSIRDENRALLHIGIQLELQADVGVVHIVAGKVTIVGLLRLERLAKQPYVYFFT